MTPDQRITNLVEIVLQKARDLLSEVYRADSTGPVVKSVVSRINDSMVTVRLNFVDCWRLHDDP